MPTVNSLKTSNPNHKSLESWIWAAACSIRGAKDAPKYKDYILPLIFTKRLCDVFDDKLDRIAKEVGSRKNAFALVQADPKLVRFFLPILPADPEQPIWSVIRKLSDQIGELLTTHLRTAGLPEPEFSLTDGFVTTLRRKAAEKPTPQVTREPESRPESRLESALAAKVVLAICEQPLGKAAIAPILGHKTVSGELHKQIKRMVENKIIEPTILDKPTSRLQKYRLTAKGRKLLEESQMEGGNE